jgi:hypothetical protein
MQLNRKSPWRVDPLALEIVMAGDAQALADFKAGDFGGLTLLAYRERLRRHDVR